MSDEGRPLITGHGAGSEPPRLGARKCGGCVNSDGKPVIQVGLCKLCGGRIEATPRRRKK